MPSWGQRRLSRKGGQRWWRGYSRPGGRLCPSNHAGQHLRFRAGSVSLGAAHRSPPRQWPLRGGLQRERNRQAGLFGGQRAAGACLLSASASALCNGRCRWHAEGGKATQSRRADLQLDGPRSRSTAVRSELAALPSTVQKLGGAGVPCTQCTVHSTPHTTDASLLDAVWIAVRHSTSQRAELHNARCCQSKLARITSGAGMCLQASAP